MNPRLDFPRRRLSPRERFVSVLRRGTLPGPPMTAWYRQKGNFYTLLTLVGFLLVFGIIQAAIRIDEPVSPDLPGPSETSPAQPTPGNGDKMDYEQARRIFNGGP